MISSRGPRPWSRPLPAVARPRAAPLWCLATLCWLAWSCSEAPSHPVAFPLSFEVSADSLTLVPGDTARLAFRFRNTSDQPFALTYPDYCRMTAYLVNRLADRTVYPPVPIACPQATVTVILEPGAADSAFLTFFAADTTIATQWPISLSSGLYYAYATPNIVRATGDSVAPPRVPIVVQ